MDYTDKIRKSKNLAERYVLGKSTKKQLEDLEIIHSCLNESASALKDALAVRSALSERTSVNSVDLSDVKSIINQMDTCLQSGNFDTSNAKVLKKDATGLKDNFEQLWDDYIEDQVADAKSVAETLGNLAQDNPYYLSMKSAERRISQKAGNRDVLKALDSYLNAYQHLIESIKLSQYMSEFLKELSKKGSVPIQNINAECLKELQESDFASKLHISIE